MIYKGAAHVLSRSAPESNLYSESQSSMGSLDLFGDPSIASGHIAVQVGYLDEPKYTRMSSWRR
ncbi:hypothetical protein F5B21DRAFT_494459 [Xylaria acuta]|nr:hypothetical protein F5B21DRAFT_494459 [Xylaria acuta]